MSVIDNDICEIIELARVLDGQQPASDTNQRRSTRFKADDLVAVCEIIEPHQPSLMRKVGIVDISTRGVQFIWPAFVHSGTKLLLRVQRPGSEMVEFEAESVWCRFLRGRHHNIGAMATGKIPVRQLVSQESWLEACERNPELLDPIEGRAVVLTRSELKFKSVLFRTHERKLSINHLRTRGEVIDTLERGNADIVILDADCEEDDPGEMIATCRQRGFSGPMALLSLDKQKKRLAKLDPLKRTRFVRLPIKANAISLALRDVIRLHPKCLHDSKPIYSNAARQLGRDKALTDFIAIAKNSCAEGRHALDLGTLDLVSKVVESFLASGSSHGYHELSEAANAFFDAANDPSQKHKLASLYETIESIVDRLRPGWPEDSDT